jgi:hypothetical protein
MFNKRRSESFNFHIFPKTEELLVSNIAKARLSSTMQSDNNVFVVENTYRFNFGTKNCSCKFPFEFRVPCISFCAVLLYLRIDHLNYVDFFTSK